MTRDEMLFILWHTAVLCLAGVAIVLGYADVLLGGVREIIVAIMVGLYLLGVVLSAVRMREFRRGVTTEHAAHQIDGIETIGLLIPLVGLCGTIGGLIIGTSGVTEDSLANGTGGLVVFFIAGLSVALWATLVGTALNAVLMVGTRFVSNVAHNHAR
jgi:hypothetical protein